MKFTKTSTQSQKTGFGDSYLKLKDGESVIGVFRGSEPYAFYMKWEAGKSHEVAPDEPGAKVRFRVNFVCQDNGKYVAKVWEMAQITYNKLADIASSGWDVEKTFIKVTRKGMLTDTEYFLTPLKEPPNPQTMKVIEAVVLNILDGKQAEKKVENFTPKFGGGPDEAPWPDTDEVPF